MRKNQYEEALFKCEDERYEVDMVIENNAAAIRVLEPLAEEIAALQAAEPTVWQFRLDSRSLGVLHLKAISRIYGDHGAEMLEVRSCGVCVCVCVCVCGVATCLHGVLTGLSRLASPAHAASAPQPGGCHPHHPQAPEGEGR